MPWDNVACCVNCWGERHPDFPARTDKSDTRPRFDGDEPSACCWYCAGPIYGGIIYIREEVQVKSSDG